MPMSSDEPNVDSWKNSGFESQAQVQSILNKIKKSAKEENSKYLYGIIPPFPFSVGCESMDSSGEEYFNINNKKEFQQFWELMMDVGKYTLGNSNTKLIREKILEESVDTLSYNSFGASVAYGSIWLSMTDYGKGYQPSIFRFNSYVNCPVLMSIGDAG